MAKSGRKPVKALDAPVIATREASTRAVIRNAQTAVIAGLIGTSEEDVERGIPFLKDIPLLGWLFKSKSVVRNRTELAIFVTPYVVFDIGGNKYRLIAEINFSRRVLFIRCVLTHKEYVKGVWKS